jgi:hypothetical protein
MDRTQPQLLKHLQRIRTLLAPDTPDQTPLQLTIQEVAAVACGQRDQTSKTLGAQAILSLLQSNYDSKYESSFELFEHLKCPPGRVISTLEAALEYRVTTESVNTIGSLASMFSLSEVEEVRSSVHRRTLLTPEHYSPVLDVLFALQISNPHLRSMRLVSKQYLEHDVVLDMPAAGEISLWWGPRVPADLLWISAVWMSKSIDAEDPPY